jgi:hypothetical protein
VRVGIANQVRDLALSNLAIDSKLRGCDLVTLKVTDVFATGRVKKRASITQSKTGHPVRFGFTEGARNSIAAWLENSAMIASEQLWQGRCHERLHISTRQSARLVRDWVSSIAWSRAAAAPIPCDEPRSRRSTARQEICGRFNFCWAKRRWTAPSATSVSSLRTPWRYPKRWRSDRQGLSASTGQSCRSLGFMQQRGLCQKLPFVLAAAFLVE